MIKKKKVFPRKAYYIANKNKDLHKWLINGKYLNAYWLSMWDSIQLGDLVEFQRKSVKSSEGDNLD